MGLCIILEFLPLTCILLPVFTGFSSWDEKNVFQMQTLFSDMADEGPNTFVLGDLNNGPNLPDSGVAGFREDNFAISEAFGKAQFTQDAEAHLLPMLCEHCQLTTVCSNICVRVLRGAQRPVGPKAPNLSPLNVIRQQ